jgi:hypothetical protein
MPTYYKISGTKELNQKLLAVHTLRKSLVYPGPERRWRQRMLAVNK